jgi:hypothetical protein
MNLQLEINILKKELEEIEDESLIQTLKSILKFARKKSYESKLKPMNVKEYLTRAKASEKNIKAGKFKDIETIENESDRW